MAPSDNLRLISHIQRGVCAVKGEACDLLRRAAKPEAGAIWHPAGADLKLIWLNANFLGPPKRLGYSNSYGGSGYG